MTELSSAEGFINCGNAVVALDLEAIPNLFSDVVELVASSEDQLTNEDALYILLRSKWRTEPSQQQADAA